LRKGSLKSEVGNLKFESGKGKRKSEMQKRTIAILGTPVACVTYDSALEIVQELAREPRPTAVCPANTHILSEARHEPEFAQVW